MTVIPEFLKNRRRYSGILMHPTSLPGRFGIGDLGPEAYAFVDFLKESNQHLWQTLPLGPTGEFNCPYQSFSSFAGQPLLISPELLLQDKLLSEEDLREVPAFPVEKVDYKEVQEYKFALYKKAFENFKKIRDKELPEILVLKASAKEETAEETDSDAKNLSSYQRLSRSSAVSLGEAFDAFVSENSDWLPDYAMFMAIKTYENGKHWLDWEKKYRKPTKTQKKVIERDFADGILYEEFLQWLFFRQWTALKAYANENDVALIGDIPIFVSSDSADVWAEPRLFLLDRDGFPRVVSGVPPDYFSATGQLWGNPLYDWKYHKKTEFEWWMRRIKVQLSLSDVIRIDHFRGLESYWEVPADAENAINGRWMPGPGDDFFQAVQKTFGKDLPIIAEDLGIITDEVCALRDRYELPGMKILQFAFEDYDSAYLPFNQPYNCICYTGTHDNDTTTGWYASAPDWIQDKVRRYMNTDGGQISWDFIRTAWGSPAKIAIAPVQDLFCQGSEYRMNTPGVADGNWSYRAKKELFTHDVATRLRDTTELFGRS